MDPRQVNMSYILTPTLVPANNTMAMAAPSEASSTLTAPPTGSPQHWFLVVFAHEDCPDCSCVEPIDFKNALTADDNGVVFKATIQSITETHVLKRCYDEHGMERDPDKTEVCIEKVYVDFKGIEYCSVDLDKEPSLAQRLLEMISARGYHGHIHVDFYIETTDEESETDT